MSRGEVESVANRWSWCPSTASADQFRLTVHTLLHQTDYFYCAGSHHFIASNENLWW